MIGRQVLGGGTGYPILLSFDGNPLAKAGGLTIDWTTVAAISGSDLVTTEGYTVKVGAKYLRYGQVLTKITTALAHTLTVTGTPTGGSLVVNLYRPDTGQQGTVTIPFNASVAAVQTLLDASILGTGGATVSGAGALPGNVHTWTYGAGLAGLIVPLPTIGANNLTGGTNSAGAFAVGAGGQTGKFGPYDPAASDGRQTLTVGNCFLLNESLVQGGIVGLGTAYAVNVDQVGAIYGGRVWKDRLIQSGVATHTLALGPTLAELLAAFPMIQPVAN